MIIVGKPTSTAGAATQIVARSGPPTGSYGVLLVVIALDIGVVGIVLVPGLIQGMLKLFFSIPPAPAHGAHLPRGRRTRGALLVMAVVWWLCGGAAEGPSFFFSLMIGSSHRATGYGRAGSSSMTERVLPTHDELTLTAWRWRAP